MKYWVALGSLLALTLGCGRGVESNEMPQPFATVTTLEQDYLPVKKRFFDHDHNGWPDEVHTEKVKPDGSSEVLEDRHYIARRDIKPIMGYPVYVVPGEDSLVFTIHEEDIKKARESPDRTYIGEGVRKWLEKHPHIHIE